MIVKIFLIRILGARGVKNELLQKKINIRLIIGKFMKIFFRSQYNRIEHF
jgi:hypothetical protein